MTNVSRQRNQPSASPSSVPALVRPASASSAVYPLAPLMRGDTNRRRGRERGFTLASAAAWAAGCALCLLFFSKVVANGEIEDGKFSLAAALGIAPSEKTTREHLRWLWHASSETEPYWSIVNRSLWFCGGAARRSEVVRLASYHPRARVDPDWRSEIGGVADSLTTFDTSDDKPVCELFR